MAKNFCLVTGGAGFIGCAISHGLADRFDRVVAIDNLHSQIHKVPNRPSLLDPRVELRVGDVTAHDFWPRLLQDCRPDVIIHLAAETGTGQSLTEATRHSHTNVCGTTVMLDALANHNVLPRRILLASSRAVYGEGGWLNLQSRSVIYPGQRTREQLSEHNWDFDGSEPLPVQASITETHPVSVYGATKLAQENVLRAWASAFGPELVTLRLQNVYGPGQSLTNAYTGIVPLFCQIARSGKSIPLYEDGRMKRDFVFIEDVAAAVFRGVDLNDIGSLPLDVGTGVATTIKELAYVISGIYGAPEPHVTAQFRFGDVRHAFCQTDATALALKWTPEYDLTRGLQKLCMWLDKNIAGNDCGREQS